MAHKIYTTGNYFFIKDLDTNKEFEGFKKEVRVRRLLDTSDNFYFDNVNSWENPIEGLVIGTIQKENGSLYTLQEFLDFKNENTGNFNSPSSGATAGTPASQSEVNAGTNTDKFVSPNTFVNASKWNDKVTVVSGKSLIDNTEISRLASMTAIFTTALKNTYDSLVTSYNALVLTGQRLITSGEITKLGNITGTNTGDETTLTIQTKRPLKTINSQSLEGTGDIVLTGSITAVNDYVGSYAYQTNELVKQGVRTLRRIASGTSGAVFNNAEASQWDLVSSDEITSWSILTYYYAGEILYSDNSRVIQRVTNGISGLVFDQTESNEYSIIKPLTTTAFSPNSYYFYDELIEQNGLIYARSLSGISASSFNATEQTNWRLRSESSTPIGVATQTKTTNYTVLASDGSLLLSPSGTTQTITLPSSLPNEKEFSFAWTVNSTKTITFTTSGGSTIVSPFTNFAGALWTTADSSGLVNGTQLFIKFSKINNIFNTTVTINSIVQTQTLTYGRVRANVTLPTISYATTGVGTPINFDSNLYSSGMTLSGTNGFIPSISGRYRAEWFAMVGSTEVNGDGIFRVVQNGVSIGQIYVNMMEAAGVNQIAPFIDVDLVAGQLVTLNYQPSVADSIPFEVGSYFQLSQLPTATLTVIDGTVPVNDVSASGYIDLGTMRMQWGTHNDANVDTTTVTLPASFANSNYAVNATSNTSAGSLCTETKTTTSFDIDRASTTTTTQLYSWFAIGLKP